MAESFVPASLQEMWNACNIRGFILLSLFLQVLLASISRLRKKSTNRFVVFVIWSAYFMADWAATFTFGLISNAQRNNSDSTTEVNGNLLAFWAAFLLIHLGGPDMITAFSMEDNALWMRHLVGLVAQLFTFSYIFLKTLPENNLIVPTVLIAVAGAIKYAERTRALYLASMGNLKKSIERKPTSSVGDSSDGDSSDGDSSDGDSSDGDSSDGDSNDGDSSDGDFWDRRLKQPFYFFQIFKGLVVDITPDQAWRSQSREFFLNKKAGEAFTFITDELDLLYDLFYTKILSAKSPWGVLVHAITYYNVVAALVLYCLSKKEGFHEVDIWITYFLLVGVVAVETISGMMLMLLDFWRPKRWFHVVWVLSQGLFVLVLGIILYVPLVLFTTLGGSEQIFDKSWYEKLGAFSLLAHCFGQCHRRYSKPMKYARMILGFVTGGTRGHTSWNSFNEETRDFIFEELKERALVADDKNKVKEIYEARGNEILMKIGNASELMRYVNEFDYDKSLLAWHIATEICRNVDGSVDLEDIKQRELAVTLSDYMNYLLIKKPEMMSTVAGIGHIRYRDTCAEIKHYCRVFKAKTINQFCTRILAEDTSIEHAYKYKDKRTSVWSDACNLARALRQKDNKWEIISRVWLELLTYAAGHCRPEKHVQALSEGGELVTIVWLLMAHFGIGPHFPYPED